MDRYILSENKFYHYSHQDDNPKSISDNYITAIFEDSKGTIWLGTRNKGLNRYNPSDNSFTHFLYDEKDPYSLSSNNVWSICEDHSGNLWIATRNGISKLNLNSQQRNSSNLKFKRYNHVSSDAGSLSGNNIRAVSVDHEGYIWAGAWDNGLNRFDEKTGKFTRYKQLNDKHKLAAKYIRSIHEDKKGNLWLAAYEEGLMLYNRSTNSFDKYSSDEVETLYEDKSGILWIGTFSEGVQMFDWRMNRFKHYFDDKNNPHDLNGKMVMAIHEDARGELWVGTYGGGLNHYDRYRRKVSKYLSNPNDQNSLSNNKILSICASKDGSLWIGSWEGGVNRFDKRTGKFTRLKHIPGNKNSLSSNDVSVLFEDSKGDLWIGNQFSGVDVYHPVSKTFTHHLPDKNNPRALRGDLVSAIFEDRQGTIWIGTLSGGLFSYTTKTNSFKHHHQPNKKYGTLSNNEVGCIYQDKSGILWIGTYGGGLNRYDPKSETYIYYTDQNGLCNNTVYGILPDMAGNLWLSTNMGLSRFNPNTVKFTNYDVQDGLQGNEFNQGSYFASPSGELFFGGTHGFNSFFPDKIESNTFIPPVYLTSFRVFDKPIKLASSLTTTKEVILNYSQNFFSFEFTALNFTSPEKNQYMYMLEGFDQDWHVIKAQRRYASYINLDPGEYILRVKGSNNDGVWNKEGTSLAIIITPPFWKTWWFTFLMVLLVIGLLYSFYRYRLNKLLAVERTRLRISQDLHDEVSASITGIVYFVNALTSTLGEIISPNVKKLLLLINENAVTVQESMSDIIWSINPRNDSWGVLFPKLRRYVSDLSESKGIKYTANIPAQLGHHSLEMEMRHDLWLIFKEMVTNAVKHSCCSHLEVSICENNGAFHMIISDDGVGFNHEVSTDRNGVKNIFARIKAIRGNVNLNTSPGKGTRWEVWIPF